MIKKLHPLTDEMIEVIHKDYVIGKILGPKTKAEFDKCLRAAYNLAIQHSSESQEED